MTATIYSFPKQEKVPVYRVPLYSDEEVEATLIVVNVFYDTDRRFTDVTVTQLNPEQVIECLKTAIVSGLFSEKFKSIIKRILANVEQVI